MHFLFFFFYFALLFNSTFVWSLRDNNKLHTVDNAFKRPWMSQLNLNCPVWCRNHDQSFLFFFLFRSLLLRMAINIFFPLKIVSLNAMFNCVTVNSHIRWFLITVILEEFTIARHWYESHTYYLLSKYLNLFLLKKYTSLYKDLYFVINKFVLI